MSRSRQLLVLLAAVLVLGLWWWSQGGEAEKPSQSSPTSQSSPESPAADGLGTIAWEQLPVEGRQTVELIQADGPFPYDRDGVVFENREAILPDQPRGYFHEYTVPTPGSDDRGARRIVTGGATMNPDDWYYTDDHYDSFRRIEGIPQ